MIGWPVSIVGADWSTGNTEHVTDDAFSEHAFYFQFCVYVRYVKGAEYGHECRRKMSSTKKEQGCFYLILSGGSYSFSDHTHPRDPSFPCRTT